MSELLGTKRMLQRAGAKAIAANAIQTGQADFGNARLSPEQANAFINYTIDQTVMMKEGLRVIRMRADRYELNSLSIGTRALRLGSEGVAPTLTGVIHAKRVLTAVEVILAADITFSYLEDTIATGGAEGQIAQMFAKQLANDIEDLGINGAAGGGGTFVEINDGWLTLIKAVVASRFDTNASTDYRNVVFKGMLAALPVKFKVNKANLRFYVSTNVEEAYRYQIGQRQTAGGDAVLQGGGRVTYDGVPVVPVPFLSDSDLLLTPPDNLAFGIHRDITLGQFRNERTRSQEYTWTFRTDYEIVEPTAMIVGYDAP